MAANFVVLAYSAITDSGPTTLCGDLGIAPLAAVSGGYVFTCGGAPHVTDSAAAQAKLDLSAAYDDAALRTPTTPVAGDLAGVTLSPGVYKSTSSLNISAPGLTLDALGDPNGVFIFQMVSTLITGPGSTVTLAGGAQAKNVFWQVGSTCALDTTTDFKGTIMAYGTIALNTGAMVQGRVLSKTDEVTMLTNNITMP